MWLEHNLNFIHSRNGHKFISCYTKLQIKIRPIATTNAAKTLTATKQVPASIASYIQVYEKETGNKVERTKKCFDRCL